MSRCNKVNCLYTFVRKNGAGKISQIGPPSEAQTGKTDRSLDVLLFVSRDSYTFVHCRDRIVVSTCTYVSLYVFIFVHFDDTSTLWSSPQVTLPPQLSAILKISLPFIEGNELNASVMKIYVQMSR